MIYYLRKVSRQVFCLPLNSIIDSAKPDVAGVVAFGGRVEAGGRIGLWFVGSYFDFHPPTDARTGVDTEWGGRFVEGIGEGVSGGIGGLDGEMMPIIEAAAVEPET